MSFPHLPFRLKKRRCASLLAFAGGMLAARGEGRALAHVAWLALAGLAFLVSQVADLGWFILPTLALFAALCVIAVFDARYFLIPDGLVIFLFLAGLLTLLPNDKDEIPFRLAAAVCAYGALRLIDALYERWRGEAGLGHGDAKLFAVAGLWLGFRGLPSCLLAAVLSALVAAILSYRAGALTHSRQPIPFGPHLALGLWLVWAIGPLESG
jgi:leader peptidase (prepilin peptidase)/N-methyltransferase